ncbi:MAG: hypothetical protein ACRDYU_05010, partial [Actinomycetes bacterium]
REGTRLLTARPNGGQAQEAQDGPAGAAVVSRSTGPAPDGTAEPAGSEGRRRPPDVLVVQLSPLVVDVTPGGTDRVDVRVHNDDAVAHDVEVRVAPSPGCGMPGGVAARLHVPAHGYADVALPVQVPRTSASRPGRHPYHVSVTRRGEETPSDRCAGHVTVGTFDQIGAELQPAEASTRGWGQPVDGRLVLHNLGNRPALVDAVVHHGPGLRRVLDPVRVTVPAGQSVVYGLRWAPSQAFWLGRGVRHVVRVEAVSSVGTHATAQSALLQRGRVAWWVLPALLIIALVVAGVLSGRA